MNRHLRIFDFAVSALMRNRFKTFVVISVYSFLICMLASLLLYVKALRQESHFLLQQAPEIIVQKLKGGRHELIPVERADQVRSLRGVLSATPRVWGYYYDPPTGATLTFWGAGSVPREALEFEEGALTGDGELGACVVGHGVAEIRFLGIGDRLPIKGADGSLFAPRVQGIFAAESALLTNDLVVMPTDTLRLIFGMDPGICTDIAVEVHHPQEVVTVARKIQELWPDVRTISRQQILQTYDAVFDWRGGLWAALLLSTIVAFAILVWDKATGLSAEEYRAIGVLKAVGWTTRDVMELKLWEGTLISFSSLLAGLIAAEIHLLWLDGALFTRVLKGWSVLFPPFDISLSLDAYGLVLCLPFVVLPYVTASLVPSWRAAITDPDSVMRS